MKQIVLIATLILAFVFEAFTLELPAIFTDNMVLQRNARVTIWGKADAGEKITIEGSWGAGTSVLTGTNGSWSAKLQTPAAGGPYTLNISSGNNKIKLKNVLIGEVWLCSGQSNMEMPLKGWPPEDTILNSEKEIHNANYPDIRLFTVQRKISLKPLEDCEGSWEACTPGTVRDFSATAYFFGRKLHSELGIPIGLIHSSWGGTPVESWISSRFLGKEEGYESTVEKIRESIPRIREPGGLSFAFFSYDTQLAFRLGSERFSFLFRSDCPL